MKKIASSIVVLILAVLFLFGCWEPAEPVFYKGIEQAEFQLPNSCEGSQNDACETYSCLNVGCWCDSSPYAVLNEGTGEVMIESKEQAEAWVSSVIIAKALNDDNFVAGEVTDSVEGNGLTYVVYVDTNGEETLYTVFVDGAIIETICGV